MDADPLSLLIIMKTELFAIADALEPEIIEDIITDNGLNHHHHDDGKQPDNNKNNLNILNKERSSSPISQNEHDEDEEDEKAQELQEIKELTKHKMDNHQIAKKIDELIENYLVPTIKQLNKKQKKKRKRSNIDNDYQEMMNGTNTMNPLESNEINEQKSDLPIIHNSHSMPLLYQSPPHHAANNNNNYHNNNNNNNNPYLSSSSSSRLISEPGQVIDDMGDLSEKCGSCFRKFFTSFFCGCGIFQTVSVIFIFAIFALIFIFYRATEITLILKELNHWKELSVKRVEYELTSQQKLAEINFDLDVDIDKMKQEHKHREYLEIIEAKKSLTKEFIDRNTRTVTTTYWNFLTTETETVSQTIFSEEDIAFFQNTILYHGFDIDKAIGYKSNKQQKEEEQQQITNDGNEEIQIREESEYDDDIASKTTCTSSDDSFDSI